MSMKLMFWQMKSKIINENTISFVKLRMSQWGYLCTKRKVLLIFKYYWNLPLRRYFKFFCFLLLSGNGFCHLYEVVIVWVTWNILKFNLCISTRRFTNCLVHSKSGTISTLWEAKSLIYRWNDYFFSAPYSDF